MSTTSTKLLLLMRPGLVVPLAATSLAAAQDGADVDLTWTDNAANNTGYYVYRSSDGVSYTKIATIGDVATYTDTSPSGAVSYYVSAYNAAGETASSVAWLYDYFVDSVSGDDGNDGSTPALAFATIGQLTTAGFAAGESVGLKGGSTWREQLTMPGIGCTIGAYGTGNAPVLDASNIQANASFSKTGGLTNVYEISVATSATGEYINAWEDDVALARVADAATADGTPGTYAVSAESGTITLYVHASDSSNVTANGKVYTCSVRNYGIYSNYDTTTVTGIKTQKNQDNDGSLVLAGEDNVVTNCTANHGAKHNMLVGEGSEVSGCPFTGAQYTVAGGGIMLVCYSNNFTGKTFTVTNCTFAMAAASTTIGGILAHQSGTGTLSNITISGCTFTNVNVGVTCEETDAMTVSGCTFAGCVTDIRQTVTGTHTISSCTRTGNGKFYQTNVVGAVATISGCTLTSTTEGGQGVVSIMNNSANVTVSNTSITGTGFTAVGNGILVNSGLTGVSVTVNQVVFSINGGYNLRFLAAPTYIGDFNTFNYPGATEMNNHWAGTNYTVLATWQAFVAPQDANSTVG